MDVVALIQEIRTRFPNAIAEESPVGIVLHKDFYLPVMGALRNELSFESLHCLTAVDRKDKMEVVCHLHSYTHRFIFMVKVVLPYADLSIPTLTPLWQSANWFEREVFDLFGITFIGHPDPRRIMNPDDWTAHPLRKDFKSPDFIPRPVK